jgi:hypothetical protein
VAPGKESEFKETSSGTGSDFDWGLTIDEIYETITEKYANRRFSIPIIYNPTYHYPESFSSPVSIGGGRSTVKVASFKLLD